MSRLRVVFAKRYEGLRAEVEDFLRVHVEKPEWFAFKLPRDVELLLEVYDLNPTFHELTSDQTRLIKAARDRARVLRDSGKLAP